MMSLALLYNIPTTPEEMAAWSWNHMAEHRTINEAIFHATGITLPEYVLDPVNIDDPTGFLDLHQQMHQNADAILGIAGYDLQDIDWEDPAQRAGWIQLNALLHVQEANATGAF